MLSNVDARVEVVLDEVVLVDEHGHEVGTAPRESVHTRDTPLHRAFSVYLFDDQGRTLLTRRALGKTAWPGVWTNSCCGHPRPGETDEQAIHRRVGEELGVAVRDVTVVLPAFRYRAVDAGGVVEHEVCPVYVAHLDAPVSAADPAEVMDHSWVPWAQLPDLVAAAPQLLSPWMVLQVPELAQEIPVDGAGAARRAGRQPVPACRDTLDGVDELLTQEGGWLHTQWRSARVDRIGADLLAGEDLPTWLARLLGSTGKRIRPSMCHWGFVAAGGTRTGPGYGHAVRIAAGLEILHVFALIHDDVMDESESRRGVPSAHAHARALHETSTAYGEPARYGDNLAILLGDLAHMQADRLVDPLPAVLRRAWYELCAELIAGQSADLLGAASGTRDYAQADRIAELKSGAYTIERPLLLGAMAAAAGEEVRAALTAYGNSLGRAFALRDDILGVWGDPARTGKPSGDDLHHRKPTILWVMAQERLGAEPAQALQRVGTPRAHPDDVGLLQQAMTEAGLRDRAEDRVRRHVDEALAALGGAALTPEGVEGLTATASSIAWRDA